jgi:hypothetical protein
MKDVCIFYNFSEICFSRKLVNHLHIFTSSQQSCLYPIKIFHCTGIQDIMVNSYNNDYQICKNSTVVLNGINHMVKINDYGTK